MLNWMYWTAVPHLVQVSFGRDFEQQLSFCVEARATFCNLEPVLVQLIHVSKHQFISSWLLLRSTCNLRVFLFLISRRLTSWQWKPEKWWKGITPGKQQPSSEWVLLLLGSEGKELCAATVVWLDVCPGMCCLQFHHHPITQQHLQPPQPLSAVWSGRISQPVFISGWEAVFPLFNRSFPILLFSLVLLPCSWFTLRLIFTLSWRFPQSSSQYPTGGSSLHQCGREISLFRELPAGLHQQLPGHASRCPGNTNYLLFSKTKKKIRLLFTELKPNIIVTCTVLRVCDGRITRSTACSTWSAVCSIWSRITPGRITVTPRYGCTPAPCPCWRPWARKLTSTPSLKVILHTLIIFICKTIW